VRLRRTVLDVLAEGACGRKAGVLDHHALEVRVHLTVVHHYLHTPYQRSGATLKSNQKPD